MRDTKNVQCGDCGKNLPITCASLGIEGAAFKIIQDNHECEKDQYRKLKVEDWKSLFSHDTILNATCVRCGAVFPSDAKHACCKVTDDLTIDARTSSEICEDVLKCGGGSGETTPIYTPRPKGWLVEEIDKKFKAMAEEHDFREKLQIAKDTKFANLVVSTLVKSEEFKRVVAEAVKAALTEKTSIKNKGI